MPRRSFAFEFTASVEWFLLFLRPTELAAVIAVCRATSARDWGNLLKRYAKFFYQQDLARLFGLGWVQDWDWPVREKLARLVNRTCPCGKTTDKFDPDAYSRLCDACAYYEVRDVKSLTTALFYDDRVYLHINAWNRDAFKDISKVPVGKRVKIVGRLSTAYDALRINRPIWIDGVNSRQSVVPATQAVIRSAVRITDLSIVASATDQLGSESTLWVHYSVTQDTVYVGDCVIKHQPGNPVCNHGSDLQLRRTTFEV